MSLLGWVAVALSLVASGLWAFWGTCEAFHEGWWAATLPGNLRITAGYLLPATIPILLTLMALRWPYVGGPLHVLAGLAVIVWWVGIEDHPLSLAGLLDIVTLAGVLLVLMGFAFTFGRPQPRWLATTLVVALPLAIGVVCAIEPIWRISHRPNDGITTARRVVGNDVELIWAPAGPGWPERGSVTWAEAEKIAAHLTEDGLSCAETPQNIWRLPTIEEVVRSLTRQGENAGGTWDAARHRASYRIGTDKESPLWHVQSPVVYWWTSTKASDATIYTICYNGSTLARKDRAMGTLAFRAVKAAPQQGSTETESVKSASGSTVSP